MEKEMISNRQFMIIISIIALASPILYVPKSVTESAGRDGWLIVLVAGIVAALNALMFFWIERAYPGKNLMEINHIILGRFLGRVLNFVYIFYFIDLCTWVLREFTDFLLITVEPSTPFYLYVVIALIMSSYTTFHGIEVYARVSEIIFPVMFVMYLFVFALLCNQYKPEHLLPILENGVIQPLKNMFVTETLFGDVMIISMIIHHVRKTSSTPMYIISGMGLSTLFTCIAVITSIMVVGAETTATLTYPTFTLIQNINIANILDRIDILIVTMWIIGVFVKITCYFMGVVYGLSTTLHVKNPRFLILPIAFAMIVISKYKVPNFIQLSTIYANKAWYFGLFQFVIPSVLLILAIIRKNACRKRQE
ncbi:endospore germination permease [Brevibacillus choshinensis]|uniref:GerAB/ArcD/ProY family transporter n=1 Tax=Brevibacillus choshinensis TaxID=54911 RepID=UPI002E2130F1|nr:endospore germination permease [Brevibacillus choshinensis]